MFALGSGENWKKMIRKVGGDQGGNKWGRRFASLLLSIAFALDKMIAILNSFLNGRLIPPQFSLPINSLIRREICIMTVFFFFSVVRPFPFFLLFFSFV